MMAPDAVAEPNGVSARRSAGTPFPLPPEAVVSALAVLEFAAALELVAGYAAGSLGADRVRGRRPSADAAWIEGELAPIAELLELFARGDGVDVAPVPPLASVLGRLRLEGSVLEGSELAAV